MGLYVGGKEITDLYVGNKKVIGAYVGKDLVRPTGWSPSSSTVAYRPLTTNLVDTIAQRSLGYSSPATVTKQTLGYRVKGGISAGSYTNVVLLSMRIKLISGTSPYCAIGTVGNPSIGYYYIHAESRLNQKFYCWTNSSFAISTASVSIGTGAWKHIVLCYNSSVNRTYAYVNGVQYTVYSGRGYAFNNTILPLSSQSSSSGSNYSGNFTADISEIILESKARTAAEVQDYYNKTKSKYGL